ncbi:hypothetical protein [Mycolicibacterium elephantis]
MTDPIAEAAARAAVDGAPPKLFQVGPNADVDFGTGPNPFDHMQVTAWVDSFDAADVAAGRSE